VLEYCAWICDTYPGARILLVRATRESLSHSVLDVWENSVLWPGHPALSQGGTATQRSFYRWPNGSMVVLGGLDDKQAERTYSARYDIVAVFEAFQVSLKNWMKLFRSLRNHKVPWQQIIADTNPDAPGHWLNVRANQGHMARFKARHEDNPACGEADLEILRRYTGVLRARLYLGEWVGAAGQVWETFDPTIHIIDEAPIADCKWFFGAMDWGWRDTGVFQVWGVETGPTRDMDRMYMVAEVYQRNRLLDWWAEVACELDAEYGLHSIVCDPSRPENIAKFNDMIGGHRGRHLSRIARKPAQVALGANNTRRSHGDLAGLDLVRWALDPSQDGGPRIYFVRDALRYGVDQTLVEASRPTRTVEEIPSYVFATPEGEEHGRRAEETDPDCWDDGCFPAGTPVLTDTGWRPIETIGPGDWVVTPTGHGLVTDAACTGFEPLLEMEHEHGSLVATGNHPIWSDGTWTRLDAMRYGDTMALWLDGLSSASGMASFGADTRTCRESVLASVTSAPKWAAGRFGSTAKSGSTTSGRSPRGITSTIATETLATMTRETLSAARQRSTAPDIRSTMSAGLLSASTLRASATWLPNGTEAQPARNGTDSTRFVLSAVATRESRQIASSAALNTAPHAQGVAASVPANARRFGAGWLAPTMWSGNAQNVARSAGAASTGCRPFAARVLRVSATGRSEPVYNLTVEPQHVYFAAGVLVSNCDTLRYACNFMWRRNLAKAEKDTGWTPGSAGDVLGIPRKLLP